MPSLTLAPDGFNVSLASGRAMRLHIGARCGADSIRVTEDLKTQRISDRQPVGRAKGTRRPHLDFAEGSRRDHRVRSRWAVPLELVRPPDSAREATPEGVRIRCRAYAGACDADRAATVRRV